MLIIYIPQRLLSEDLIILMSVLMDHVGMEESLENMSLIEDQKDIADPEVMFRAVYGYKKRRTLVLTAEPRKDIDIRKKAYFRAVEEIIKNNLRYKDMLAQHPEKFKIGKLIVVNFKKFNFSELPLKSPKVCYIR